MFAARVVVFIALAQAAACLYVTDKNRLWPNKTILYEYGVFLRNEVEIRPVFAKAVKYMNSISCLKWIQKNPHREESDPNVYVQVLKIIDDDVTKPVARADVGYEAYDYRFSSLPFTAQRYLRIGETFFRQAKAVSENFALQQVLRLMMHVMGFQDEHQRADRDCYVWVRDSHKRKTSFVKVSSLHFGTQWPYDFHSVTHFPAERRDDPFVHSKPHNESITLGRLDGLLSEYDKAKIRALYCAGPFYCYKNQARCDRIKLQQFRTPDCYDFRCTY